MIKKKVVFEVAVCLREVAFAKPVRLKKINKCLRSWGQWLQWRELGRASLDEVTKGLDINIS